MRELKIEELKIVSGANGPIGAAGGAIVAGASYAGYAIGNGTGSMAGFAGAAAAGAAAGFIVGPASYPGIIAGAEVGFHAGMIGGAIESGISNGSPSVAPSGLNYCGSGY
jgi:hypothetical protein